jgi:hypothetical protein
MAALLQAAGLTRSSCNNNSTTFALAHLMGVLKSIDGSTPCSLF